MNLHLPDLAETITDAGLVLPLDLKDRPFIATVLPSIITGTPSEFGLHLAVQGTPPRGQFLITFTPHLDIIFLPYGGTGKDWKCLCDSNFCPSKYHSTALELHKVAQMLGCPLCPSPEVSTL
jgi:hypothetical protein